MHFIRHILIRHIDEILKKNNRERIIVYCFRLIIIILYVFHIEHEISHRYAFHFTNTLRAKKHKSGLDYSKIVIIEKSEYIDSTDAIIDKDEFNETMVNLGRIKKESLNFVEDYIAHMKGEKPLHKKEFDRRYGFSPLKYFHKELGI